MAILPPELLTLFGSSVTGSIIRILSRSMEIRRQERLITLQAINYKAQLLEQARSYDGGSYQWTRRFISITAVFFIIAFPKLVSVFYPHILVHIGYHQFSPGFLFFTASGEKVNWVAFQGLVITPLDTHLVSAIIGLYFGGSLATNR
jgi:hypothetical protein